MQIFFGKAMDVIDLMIFLFSHDKKIDGHQFLIGKLRRGIVAESLAGILQLLSYNLLIYMYIDINLTFL